MKNYIFYISIMCFTLFCSCDNEELITSKSGIHLDPVTNLEHSIAGKEAVLAWDLPSNIDEKIITPISVQIDISIDGKKEGGSVVLEDNPKSYNYSSYDPSKKYRFTVKAMASVDTSDPNVSDLLYSLGNTISF